MLPTEDAASGCCGGTPQGELLAAVAFAPDAIGDATGQAEGRRQCEILWPDDTCEAAAARALGCGREPPGFPLKERKFLIMAAAEARLENARSGEEGKSDEMCF